MASGQGAWPFATPRAWARAPRVLEHAAAGGAAALVAPGGDVVLVAGEVDALDLARVARAARRLGAERRAVVFRAGCSCVHTAPIVRGWVLCVVWPPELASPASLGRLHASAHVLALALLDGSANGGPGSQGPAHAETRPAKPRAASPRGSD